MSSVYLLRHADYRSPSNLVVGRLPFELSDAGREQCHRLHEFFADKQIGKIYSSAVVRCKQTVEIVAGGAIPIAYDKRLLETLSAFQGHECDDSHGMGQHYFGHVPELGGESFDDIQKRVVDFWNDMVAGLDQNIIICSHGDPLQLLYAHLQQLPKPQDTASASEIPGWLERGAFMEVVCDNGVVQTIRPPVLL